MKWSVTWSTNSVHVRILTLNGYNRCRSPRAVFVLHPERIGQDILVRENLVMAQTFLNQFIKVQGNYPAKDFRASGWVDPAQKSWWRDLMLYVLKYFDADLRKLRLHEAVRVTYHGIEISVPTSLPSSICTVQLQKPSSLLLVN